MGSDNDIASKMRTIVSDQLMVDIEDVTDTALLVEDLGADSLDNVELLMAIEDEFKVEISDKDAEKISTVGEAIAYMSKLLGDKES